MRAVTGRAFVLLVAASAVGLAGNALRSDGVRLAGFAAPASCEVATATAGIEVLPPTQAAAACGDPGVVIADARSTDRFTEGHVANAIHLPCVAPRVVANQALSLLAGKHTLIVYGDTTEEAQPVAEELRRGASGALRVVVLKGGFDAWNRAGFACSSGPCAECKGSAGR